MSIFGAGKSLIDLLEKQFIEMHGDRQGLTFQLFTTSDLEEDRSGYVSLFLYRLDVDPTRRHRRVRPEQPGDPVRWALSLELRYLLMVWHNSAETEHRVLQDCMTILDHNAILSGDMLVPRSEWGPDDALKVSIETMTNEDITRLWESVTPTYRLAVPYRVRQVQLPPVKRRSAPVVEDRTHVVVPRVPS